VLRETRNWIEPSDYDLKTAEHMLATGRFLYVVFMCHLAIEKLLKAIVHEVTGSLPPRSHDLIYLLKLTENHPPQNLLEFMGTINSASVVTRYPGDLSKTLAAYHAQVAENYLDRSREVLQWLRQDKRLR